MELEGEPDKRKLLVPLNRFQTMTYMTYIPLSLYLTYLQINHLDLARS
jgi:hypothetical protein